MESLSTILATASLAAAGWAVKQVMKVPALEEDVKYIRARVDAIYDHFLNRGPEER